MGRGHRLPAYTIILSQLCVCVWVCSSEILLQWLVYLQRTYFCTRRVCERVRRHSDTWDGQCLHGCVQPCVVASAPTHPPLQPPTSPASASLKPSVGEWGVQGPALAVRWASITPQCLNIYCPTSPAGRDITRKSCRLPGYLAWTALSLCNVWRIGRTVTHES